MQPVRNKWIVTKLAVLFRHLICLIRVPATNDKKKENCPPSRVPFRARAHMARRKNRVTPSSHCTLSRRERNNTYASVCVWINAFVCARTFDVCRSMSVEREIVSARGWKKNHPPTKLGAASLSIYRPWMKFQSMQTRSREALCVSYRSINGFLEKTIAMMW